MTVAAREVNRLYAFAASASVRVLEVESQLVREFCRRHNVFRQAARENEGDPLLDEVVRLSSQLRYRMLCAPLPLCHRSVVDASATDVLLKRINSVGRSYSELRDVSARYASTVADLRGSAENPLWNSAASDLATRPRDSVALVIKPARFVGAVRDLAATNGRDLEVLTESQLRSAVAFDRVYLFGAGRWYPGFVFSAPRALVLSIVRYGVLSDGPPDEPAFLKAMQRPKRALFPSSVCKPWDESSSVGADEARPTFDVAWLMRQAAIGGGGGGADHSSELVEARVLFLEQDLAVFVSASEGASELIVDLREDAKKLVYRVPAANLEPGMAVLVRTDGGGDYIVAAADRIMGEEAPDLREHQRRWKRCLRELVERVGRAEALDRLKAAGSRIANHQNLRNWMSPRSIRTQRDSDFDAIFRVIDLAEEADRNWRMMSVIDKAHRYAGNLIRRQLLQQVRTADLSLLQSEGRQDFELPGEVGGGSLTAGRIVSVSTEVVEVHGSAVHRMFESAG